MKILLVHQYFLAPGEPGGSRFNEMARRWIRAGHQVTVIAGSLNHATGQTPRGYRHRWVTREQRTGPNLTVWRCHVPSVYRRGYVGRMWGFLGFTISASTATLLSGRPDVVIATSPPLVTVIPGWIAARLRLRRAPWVFEVRDLWPESAVTTGVLAKDSLITRTLYALEQWACRRASRINVLTPAFRDDLLARGLAQPWQLVFVPNGADLELFSPGDRQNEVRREFGWDARFVVMYAGAHSRANSIGQLVEAAALLRDRCDILIAFVGDGPERELWQRTARERGLTNVMFLGPQPKERMPAFVNACDVGAAVLQDNPTFRTVYPNKVFDYMACARPILLAIDGVARHLVCDEAKAGVFASPENAQALADAIRMLSGNPRLCTEMGSNGRAWVEANAARDVLADRYLKVLADLHHQQARHDRRGASSPRRTASIVTPEARTKSPSVNGS